MRYTVHASPSFPDGTTGDGLQLTTDDPIAMSRFVTERTYAWVGTLTNADGETCDALDVSITTSEEISPTPHAVAMAREYVERFGGSDDRALAERIIANWDATPESGAYPDICEPSGFVVEAILREEITSIAGRA